MEGCQAAPCLAESPEVGGFLHQGQARQHLLEVCSKGSAVVRGVKQAVDVVEDVFLGDLGAVLLSALLKDKVCNGVLPLVLPGICIAAVEERRSGGGLLFLVVEGEALSACIQDV